MCRVSLVGIRGHAASVRNKGARACAGEEGAHLHQGSSATFSRPPDVEFLSQGDLATKQEELAKTSQELDQKREEIKEKTVIIDHRVRSVFCGDW